MQAGAETYLLMGKIICGECGRGFGGARKFSGRTKRLYVIYRCFSRDKSADTACKNPEIQRDYLEKFVLSEISKIVFNDDDAAKWLERYKEYKARNDVKGQKRIEDMQGEVQRLDRQIENLVFSIAESASSSRPLVTMTDQLERQKDDIQL